MAEDVYPIAQTHAVHFPARVPSISQPPREPDPADIHTVPLRRLNPERPSHLPKVTFPVPQFTLSRVVVLGPPLLVYTISSPKPEGNFLKAHPLWDRGDSHSL